MSRSSRCSNTTRCFSQKTLLSQALRKASFNPCHQNLSHSEQCRCHNQSKWKQECHHLSLFRVQIQRWTWDNLCLLWCRWVCRSSQWWTWIRCRFQEWINQGLLQTLRAWWLNLSKLQLTSQSKMSSTRRMEPKTTERNRIWASSSNSNKCSNKCFSNTNNNSSNSNPVAVTSSNLWSKTPTCSTCFLCCNSVLRCSSSLASKTSTLFPI